MTFYLRPPPNSLCVCLLLRSGSCEFGLSGKEMPSGRILSAPFTQTDAVGYRVDDRCLKHTLLVKLQPNSSRQLLSWTREEAPACAAPTAFPFVLKVSRGLRGLGKLQFQGQRVDGTIFLHLWTECREGVCFKEK